MFSPSTHLRVQSSTVFPQPLWSSLWLWITYCLPQPARTLFGARANDNPLCVRAGNNTRYCTCLRRYPSLPNRRTVCKRQRCWLPRKFFDRIGSGTHQPFYRCCSRLCWLREHCISISLVVVREQAVRSCQLPQRADSSMSLKRGNQGWLVALLPCAPNLPAATSPDALQQWHHTSAELSERSLGCTARFLFYWQPQLWSELSVESYQE